MPVFQYKGFGETGKAEEGEIEKPTEAMAYESISALGITVTDLVDLTNVFAPVPWYRRDISFARKRLPVADQAGVAEQLAVLFAAHLSISEIAAILAANAEKPGVRRHFARMGRLIADGARPSEAFERAGVAFSPLFVSLFRVSDASPDMPGLMRGLAQTLQRQSKATSELTAILIYPAILIAGAIALLLMIVLYLAPNLAPMFTSLNKPVPAALSTFLALGAFLRDWGSVVLLAIALAAVSVLAISQTESGKAAIRAGALRAPIWGNILRTASLARVVQALDLMLQAGSPLAKALRDTASFMKSEVFAAYFLRAAEALEKGGRAADEISSGPAFPPIFRELFRIGEETNTLPTIMRALSAHLNDRLDHEIQRSLRLLTPVITLVVGGGIGLLIYSVMSAILSVNELAF